MAGLETKMPKYSKETEDGFVRIKYRIDKLKAKDSKPPTAKNADIKTPHFSEQRFWVIITGNEDGDLKGKMFMPHIVKLPYEIVPSDCYCTADHEDIFVWLKKKDTDQSWQSEIEGNRMETADQSEIKVFLDETLKSLS